MRVRSNDPRRFRAGNALVYSTVLLVLMVGFASFAVDVGHLQMVKSELRSALDASALAGCTGLGVSPAEARTRAKTIAMSNRVDGTALTLLDSDIVLGRWDSTGRTFTPLSGSNESQATAMRIVLKLTRARGNAVKLAFAGLFGVDAVELSCSVTSAFSGAADVVVVQDITSSFSNQLSKAKQGDQAFLNTLYNNRSMGAMGLVAQTGTATTLAPLQKIQGNYTNLSNKITSLQTCGSSGMPACSGTDIAAGIEQGMTTFSAYTSTPGNIKVMVLVSDGESTQNSAGKHPTMNASQLLAQARTDADTAWSNYKIHVYVVFWNETNDATAAANLSSLKRGNGTFISVTNPSDLPVALENIARGLPAQLVQ